MSFENIKLYITHLPDYRVVACRFCEACIPPKEPLDHYENNHTSSKDYPIPMKIRRRIADYMATLDLCQPDEVIFPNNRVPALKIIKKGYICRFPGCNTCGTSEPSMRTHYYSHQKHIPMKFKNWEPTALQTFFDGKHKKYIKLFL